MPHWRCYLVQLSGQERKVLRHMHTAELLYHTHRERPGMRLRDRLCTYSMTYINFVIITWILLTMHFTKGRQLEVTHLVWHRLDFLSLG